MTDVSTTKKKRSLFLPIAAAIIALALIGFFASRAGIDKALVKQQLDLFISQMKERGKAQGRDIEITYGELEMVGSFARKHVVIHNPVLVVKPLEQVRRPGDQRRIDALRVTTPTLEIYPETADLSSLRIEASQPIDLAGADTPDKSLLKMTSNVPPSLTVTQTKINEVPYTETEYRSPSQIELVYLREQQNVAEEDKTPTVVPVYETMNVSMAQGSNVKSTMAVDNSGLGSVKTNFKDIVITPKAAPEGAVKIAELTGEWSNALNEKKLNVVHALMKFGPITSDNANAPYLPIMLDIDATYEGAMPKTPEAIASIQSPESIITVKSFTLTTKDAKLSATANFTANASDVLPVGNANVSLTNAPFVLGELRKFGLLAPQTDRLVTSVLQLVTGTAPEQLQDINIPIERARGGAFKIGNTTFEELFALFLKEALQMKSGVPVPAPSAAPLPGTPGASANPPLVPNLPPADKPKAAPIELKDQGVRG